MSSAIVHRGPDEAGFTLMNGKQIGLAHVRLNIIDLETGQQPMFNEDGTISVIFNGEVYDYLAIRQRLVKKGHVFRTTSDTEVLIHLYEQYGLDFFKELNGEFAFIIWDDNQKRLIAAKDRCGIKPLFYHLGTNEVILSSEVKGIFALDRVPKKLSSRYFTGPFLAAFPKAVCAFEGIHCLQPGHYIIVDENGAREEKEYWRQEYNVHSSMSFDNAKEGVRHHLEQAVQRRMVADVPVGNYLSGGIDSTLICAIMSKNTDLFRAFNIGFSGSEYDESSLAQEISEYYGADFVSFDCDMETIAQMIPKTIYHIEQVIVNPNSGAKAILSARIREQGYKVCITGEGADEVFAGYPYFKMEKLWRMIESGGDEKETALELWKRFQKIEKRSEAIVWDRKLKWQTPNNPFGYPCFQRIRAKQYGKYIPLLFNVEALGITRHDTPSRVFEESFDAEAMRKLDPLNVSRTITFNQLYNYVIPTLGDRVEMAHSIECRTPFLDKELLEFAGTIPPEYLMDIGRLREKHVLHEAFKDNLPPFLGKEHKHPFLAPNWSNFSKTQTGRQIFYDFMSASHLKKSGIFNPKIIKLAMGLWKILPHTSLTRKRLDMILGAVMSAQLLHFLFIEEEIQHSSEFEMVYRTGA